MRRRNQRATDSARHDLTQTLLSDPSMADGEALHYVTGLVGADGARKAKHDAHVATPDWLEGRLDVLADAQFEATRAHITQRYRWVWVAVGALVLTCVGLALGL